MGLVRRILGYGTIGLAKESARRALKSEGSLESGIFAAQAGVLSEAAKNLLEGDEFWTEKKENTEKQD